MKYIILGLVLFISHFLGNTQPKRDSLRVQAVNIVSHKLNLTDSIKGRLLEINLIASQKFDLMDANKQLSIQQRGVEINTIQTEYENAMQALLTTQQWAKYLELKEEMRAGFQQKMRNKQNMH